MMLDDLISMIEFASVNAEKIFRKTRAIYPMYHAIKRSGQTVILTPPPGDKDFSVALVKAWMEIEGVDRYVYLNEAWTVDDRRGQIGLDMEKVKRYGISNHPERREIVMFSAENRRGEQRLARRFILRPEHGKATLSPLEIDPIYDNSEGRMVGLLKLEK